MKNAHLGIALAAGLAATSFAQQLPRPAAPLVAQALNHKSIDLKQFRGKHVVVAFLLTT